VDWHEKYQFLKVGFTPDLLAETALHEIQFGHVQRNSHDNTTVDRAQFDVCAHKWTDISEGNYGVAFLNDCKYACTIKDGEYRLSLIKSGRHPDPRGDEGTHRFAYSLLPHKGGFSVESVVRPAFEFNFDVSIQLDAAAQEPWSLLSIDQPNVIVAAVKKSEDGNDLIIRLYEAGKSAGYAKLTFGMDLKSIAEVNLLEEEPVEVTLEGREAELYFRPFEIKTLRISI
jgi:alpha-mannosidase